MKRYPVIVPFVVARSKLRRMECYEIPMDREAAEWSPQMMRVLSER